MSIKIGDTIKMKFTNPKTKGVVIGFGFITEKISLADKLNFDENSDFEDIEIFEYGIFFLKCGNKINFFTNAYSGSFINSKILLLETYSSKTLKNIPIIERHLISTIF